MTFIKLIIFITEGRPIAITTAACNLKSNCGGIQSAWSSTSLYLEHHVMKQHYRNILTRITQTCTPSFAKPGGVATLPLALCFHGNMARLLSVTEEDECDYWKVLKPPLRTYDT